MDLNPTGRFSSRVADYQRYRPSYPEGLIPLLARECGLRPESQVADIGSGTGLLTKLLLRFGCEVWGVEPNADMRQAGEQLLAGEPRFHSVDGKAEHTGLESASVELVTAGQAFHWFEPAGARSECRRILRPPGWVMLVWNERLVEGRFLEGYEALLQQLSTEYAQVDHRRVDGAALDGFFGPGAWKLTTFPYEQLFDFEGLMGRLNSSSYVPAVGTDTHARLQQSLTELFAECQADGRVAFRYRTKVYIGQLSTQTSNTGGSQCV